MLRSVLLAALLVPQMAHAACETILATDSTRVLKAGDTMTGPLVMSGENSYITAVSSVNGQGFFGDGSKLSGIPSTASISGVYLPLAGGTMTGTLAVTGAGAYITSQSSHNLSGGLWARQVVIGKGASASGYVLEVSTPNAAVTTGDFYIDPANRKVTVGRQSSVSGDNSQFWVLSRTGGEISKLDGNSTGNSHIGNGQKVTIGMHSDNICSTCNVQIKGAVSVTGSLEANSLTIPAGSLSDSTIYGQDIAVSTINLVRLNQSGASDGNTIVWDNAAGRWTPGSVSGTLTGGIANVVPVWTGASTLGTGSGYITNVSTGVGFWSNITAESSGKTITLSNNYVVGFSSVQFRLVNETALSSTTYSNTSSANAGNCLTSASTFTITTVAGQYIELSLDGNISNSASVQDNTFYFEQNGAIPSPFDSTPGIGTGKKNFTNCYTPTSAQMYQCHGRVILNPGAGTYSYCIGAFTQSGTLSLTNMTFMVKTL